MIVRLRNLQVGIYPMVSSPSRRPSWSRQSTGPTAPTNATPIEPLKPSDRPVAHPLYNMITQRSSKWANQANSRDMVSPPDLSENSPLTVRPVRPLRGVLDEKSRWRAPPAFAVPSLFEFTDSWLSDRLAFSPLSSFYHPSSSCPLRTSSSSCHPSSCTSRLS